MNFHKSSLKIAATMATILWLTTLAPDAADAVSAGGQRACTVPKTTWGTGGTSSGYMYVSAATKEITGNRPYYYTLSVDSGKSYYPISWSASSANLQFGSGFCA